MGSISPSILVQNVLFCPISRPPSRSICIPDISPHDPLGFFTGSVGHLLNKSCHITLLPKPNRSLGKSCLSVEYFVKIPILSQSVTLVSIFASILYLS